jgi:hypothetical protein
MSVHCYVSGGGASVAAIAALHPAWTVKTTKLAPWAALNRACKTAAADIVVLIDAQARVAAPIDGLLARLDAADILLLARQPDAGDDFQRDLHIARTGTFNLGFLAVRTTGEGRRFAAWWADRVSAYPEGVDEAAYLDQRWCDLVPGLFDKVAIERRPPPGLNLAFDRAAA